MQYRLFVHDPYIDDPHAQQVRARDSAEFDQVSEWTQQVLNLLTEAGGALSGLRLLDGAAEIGMTPEDVGQAVDALWAADLVTPDGRGGLRLVA